MRSKHLLIIIALLGLAMPAPTAHAGDDAVCAADPVNNLDQRGVARPQGAHCDIGALEQLRFWLPLMLANNWSPQRPLSPWFTAALALDGSASPASRCIPLAAPRPFAKPQGDKVF